MMDSERTIENLNELIAPKLGVDEKIVSTDISRLTAPGENYGSIMLRIIITLENENTKQKRSLDLVGKIPPESEIVRKVFTTELTFLNEYKFYAVICPLLDSFLKKNNVATGIDFLAPYINGRLNLRGTDTLDSNGIILMENLKTAGYSIGKKAIGLDLEHCKIVLKSLARYHAAGMGLKTREPKVFQEKLKPYFFTYVPDDSLRKMVRLNFEQVLSCNGFNKEQVTKIVGLLDQGFKKVNVTDIWGTMIHYDSWTNNLLIKYENGKPTNCIIVDFQVCDYGTPLNDVTFFLFTSVQKDIFDEHLDDLVDYYYNKLLEDLHTVGVDTAPYTRESFEKEIAIAVSKYEYYHTMWMLQPIMVEEFKSLDDLHNDDTMALGKWSSSHIQKIIQITKACLKRNWI